MLTGEIFVKEGLISEEQLETARARKEERGANEPIAVLLVKFGYIEERDRVRVTGKMWGMPFADLTVLVPDPDALEILPAEDAKRYHALPLEVLGNRLTVVMSNPLDIFVVDELRMTSGCEIEPMIGVQAEIDEAIVKHYQLESSVSQQICGLVSDFDITVGISTTAVEEDDDPDEDDAPIVRLSNLIIHQAVADKASDIHMEPRKDGMVVRYRVDGVMVDVMTLPKKVATPLTSRMKIVANMDIAEKRVPQDNRIGAVIHGKPYDFRVSTLPVVYGEKIVMRVLDKGGINVGLDNLGFLPDNLKLIEDLSSKSYGILLVTGPTGSGKSTTLYSVLNKMNNGKQNIITIEDPVEYELDGINQCSVNTKAGMTFAAGLRSMLRQDPDIIMVGEMRDSETATIAMEAALTGHFVLSTLHTNDAASAPTRLVDMDVEPFLISSSIVGVLAQRLLRRICPSCKETYEEQRHTLERFGFPIPEGTPEVVTLYRGAGCEKCKHTGYRGRTGIHELMEVNDEIRDEILKRSPSHILRNLAVKNNMRTLQMDAIAKTFLGVTTVEEVLRVIYA